MTEIVDAKNDYNLNLPRYIDSSEPEDVQDINGHLRGVRSATLILWLPAGRCCLVCWLHCSCRCAPATPASRCRWPRLTPPSSRLREVMVNPPPSLT